MQYAFTLVELLVVIGIITVLLGIFLPVLSRARESGRQTVCASNLRQLGVALTLYLNQWNRYPRPAQNAPSTQMNEDWVHFHSWRNPEEGSIAKYLSKPFNAAIYRCPSDDPASHKRYTMENLSIHYPYSYTANEGVFKLMWRNELPLRPNKIKNPSEKILLIEESFNTIDDGCWAWQPQLGGGSPDDPRNVLGVVHDRRTPRASLVKWGRGNALMADMSVKFLGRQESYDRRQFDPLF
ncbi:MAG: type II secretion system GspH family protein [Candidatus Doudnabacteria bacterium]|nr:type II secretion system GspH family protein [Candidatus Doudnabacteria bacterium]